jgi:hypothetical protein
MDIPQQPNLTPSSYSSFSGVPSAACQQTQKLSYLQLKLSVG